MTQKYKYKTAVFLTIILMALISAPTIIVSFDDTSDVTCFYSIAEEEEENLHVKLVLEHSNPNSSDFFEEELNTSTIGYTFKQYPKPHLNLISPPPDFI